MKPLAVKAEPGEKKEASHKEEIKSIYQALKAGREPDAEEVTLVGPEMFEKIKAKAAEGEKRGRKPGASAADREKESPVRDVVKEPGVKVIDDKEERIAKQAGKNKKLEDTKLELINLKKAMKEKVAEWGKAEGEAKTKLKDELAAMTEKRKQLDKELDKIS